ncbi:MAG TPA: hypothetical protein VFU37_02765 [Pyrinomonadaceae bacterium]|nr:hypothetical protein [Pyrinomonadaceae bacterium]
MEAGRVKDVRSRVMVVFPLVCLIALAASVKAQRTDPAKEAMQEMDRREMQLNNLGRSTSPANDRKRSQALMDQVNEDFQRILTLHNEIVRGLAADKPFDDQFISDAAGEIKKRSARLQSTLKLSKPEPPTASQQRTPDPKVKGIKGELILLCQQIENFVRNPIIETPGTVDAQQVEKARHDLQSIVEISDAIKKHASHEKP